ncbi:disease resistance protein RPV1-like [Eucalyptus grandis]|uniref:disease resistance protein RPV1-like n=1 Tax=Eucalyptus grandis TaxID=71139 RepID=UPI00192EEB14|nr:disease resistance protein RPV1-like [Eucalyptus grandis]
MDALPSKGCPKKGSLERLSEIIMPSKGKPFKLPETLDGLKSLIRFEVRNHDGISQLPDSIGRLTNLTHLLLPGCKSLYKLPDSIGELKSFVHLDLEQSGIRAIPDSIGNLKRLKIIRVGHPKIERIPCAIGRTEMLEEVDAPCCYHLKDESLWEMESLTRLRILNLDWTPISTMPTMISGFSSLQTLMITSQKLCPLPELPSSLKCLVVAAAQFPFLPDLSSLVHLDHFEVWRLDSSTASSGANEVISPWRDAQSIHQLPRSLSELRLSGIPQLPIFSDFKSLSVLIISGCPLPHFPAFEYLERLRELKISLCEFLESTPSMLCLKRIQKLQLSDLPKLAEIPGLGQLESLKFLHISRCNAIEQLPNLSKLQNLRHLRLVHCGKIRAIEGLKELISLKNAEIKRCMSLERLPNVSASTKLDTKWKWQDAAEDI